MTNQLKFLYSFFHKNYIQYISASIILVLTSLISIIYTLNNLFIKGLNYQDAWSRLNIARRVIDNITPGLTQIGNVWLPFPQLLITPFASIDYLYHSGLAGSIVSGISFIIGGLYLFNLTYKITRKMSISWLSLALFISNKNLLFFQSTSMSESFFIFTIITSANYLYSWLKSNQVKYVVFLSFCLIASTLTRYEGYFSWLICLFIIIVAYGFQKNGFKNIDGKLILFITLSTFGIIIWLLYFGLIFNDPLLWLKIYTNKHSVISFVSEVGYDSISKNSLNYTYLNILYGIIMAIFNINGFIFFIIFILSLFMMIFTFKFKFLFKFDFLSKLLTLLFLFSPTMFIIIVYLMNFILSPPPNFSIYSFFDINYSNDFRYNPRNYIIMYPFMILTICIIYKNLNLIFKRLILSLIFIHFLFSFHPKLNNFYTLWYSDFFYIDLESEKSISRWFKNNYRGGKILMSMSGNDSLAFQIHLPQINYIHEGTRHNWINALKYPDRKVEWIILSLGSNKKLTNFPDLVTYYLQDTIVLKNNFRLVFASGKYVVYKNTSQFSRF